MTWRPFTVFSASAAAAWLLLVFGGGPILDMPVLCTSSLLSSLPDNSQLEYVLFWVSPAQLSTSWSVMLIAMMLPIVSRPIDHVRVRSFRSERAVNTLAFLVGYFSTWMLAGFLLIGFALFLRLLVSEAMIPFTVTLGLAAIWQLTTWKQIALNKCHAQPPLASFGIWPLKASVRFGLSHARWCLVSCLPLMLTTLTVPTHGLWWMIIITIWIWAERLELPQVPTFGLRIPQRALRAGHFQISAFLKQKRSP